MTERPVAPSIEFVIPVHNEERILRSSIERLHEYLDRMLPFPWQITIADNASTDATRDIADELAATLDRVGVVRIGEKGRGRALRAAWLASNASIVAYMDADLSTDLSAVLPLVAPLVSGHSEVSIGSRFAPGATVARGPRRELISRCYNLLLRLVFVNRFRDAQCGFKAVRSDVARALLPEVEDEEWFFDTELLLLAERNGLRVHELPIDWVDDRDTRVQIMPTIRHDLAGVWRLARHLARGRGRVDLGALARPSLNDDMGRQFVGFAYVGVLSTLATIVLFLVLREPVGSIWANVIAMTATHAVNIWATRRYTFGCVGQHHRSRHYLGAFAVWVIGVVGSTAALAVAVVADVRAWLEVLVLLGSYAVLAVVRLVLLRSVVFRAR